MKSPLNKLLQNPKQIFLIDAMGALLTCLLLILIQTKLQFLFGMPAQTLQILAAIAFVFFGYSTMCFLIFDRIHWKLFLKIIASANLIYGALTLGLLVYNYPITTPIDWVYFLGEIGIIVYLVSLEIRMIQH
jgi:hypothetical protein